MLRVSGISLRLAPAAHHGQEVIILRRPTLELVKLRAPGLQGGNNVFTRPCRRHRELRGCGDILEERSERGVRSTEAGGGTAGCGVTRK